MTKINESFAMESKYSYAKGLIGAFLMAGYLPSGLCSASGPFLDRFVPLENQFLFHLGRNPRIAMNPDHVKFLHANPSTEIDMSWFDTDSSIKISKFSSIGIHSMDDSWREERAKFVALARFTKASLEKLSKGGWGLAARKK